MERYKQIVKIEKIKELTKEKNYDEAIEIASSLNMTKIKNTVDICAVADVYKAVQNFDKAKMLYQLAYEKSPSRRILTELIKMSIKTKCPREAEGYLNEYEKISPNDYAIYIYRYNIAHLKKKPVNELIDLLKELCSSEYIDRWAYELVRLYHKAGMKEECINECNEIILWFGYGEYVDKARALLALYNGELSIDDIKNETADISNKINDGLNQQDLNKDREKEQFTELYQNDVEEQFMGSNQNDEEEQFMGSDQLDVEEQFQDLKLSDAEEETEELYRDVVNEQQDIQQQEEAEEQQDVQQQEESEEQQDIQQQEEAAEQQDIQQQDEAERQQEEELRREVEIIRREEENYRLEQERNYIESEKEEIKRKKTEEDDRAFEQTLNKIIEESDDGKSSEEIEEEEAMIGTTGILIDLDALLSAPLIPGDSRLKKILDKNNTTLEEAIGRYTDFESIGIQLVRSLEILLNIKAAGLGAVISGSSMCGKTTLAKGISKILHMAGRFDNSGILLIDSAKLNSINIKEKLDKLKGHCIVIQRAGGLTGETADIIAEVKDEICENTVIILEDDRTALTRLFRTNMSLNKVFSNRINMPAVTCESLYRVAARLLKHKDYRLNETAARKMEKMIKRYFIEDKVKALPQVDWLVRQTIKNTDIRLSKNLLQITNSGKLSEYDMTFIHEKDIP